jgi:Domain of unknown function (DUF4402)
MTLERTRDGSSTMWSCKGRIILALLAMLALRPASACAQTITETTQLTFGAIVLIDHNAVGRVTVDQNGGYSYNSNIYLIEDPETGIYDITGGPPNATYTVTFTYPSVTITRSGINFIVDNFTVGPATLSTDGSGEDTFRIGARMQSQAGLNYADGVYNGTIEVNVNF